MNDDEAIRALEEHYATLPEIRCRGDCKVYCRGIRMSEVEERRIEEFRGAPIPEYGDGVYCPLLEADGKCGVYPVRPAICREWGTSIATPCGFGCQPSRLMTEAECQAFLQRSLELGGGEAKAHTERLLRYLRRHAEP